jgi:hypothetical protein
MTHNDCTLAYVAGVLISFGLAFPSLRRNWSEWRGAKCSCCDDLIPAWQRIGMCLLVVGIYELRSLLWFVAIPVEFFYLVYQGLKERQKQ